MIKEDQMTVLPNLNSNHEEADKKLVALVCAANVPSEESIMVRSPSGDIDILTLSHMTLGIQKFLLIMVQAKIERLLK